MIKNNNYIQIKNLTVEIGNKKILDGINLEFEDKKSISIIGESGSGKTILSKLLVGKKIDGAKINGEILYRGKNILTISDKELFEYRGKEVVYVSQNPMAYFNPMVSIKKYAREILKSNLDIGNSQSDRLLLDALHSVNLENAEIIMEKYPFELSGGMLQRIMFAIMINLDPKIIIADEPTSALDSKNTKIIIDILKNLKNRGKNIITVTHEYKLVRELADYVIIIKNGKLIESGEKEQVLENPKTEYTRELLNKRTYERSYY